MIGGPSFKKFEAILTPIGPYWEICTNHPFKLADNIKDTIFTNQINYDQIFFQLALEPLLAAESDRALCKTARIARDAEEEVMKDVEGWEVGTWFGHKVFKTIDNP